MDRRWQPASVWALAVAYGSAYAVFSLVTKVSTASTSGNSDEFKLASLIIFSLIVGLSMLLYSDRLGRRASFLLPAGQVQNGFASLVSGAATSVIVLTTFISFSFAGVSIILALLMMRGGVLVISPVIDVAAGRKIYPASVVLLAVSICVVGFAILNSNTVINSRFVIANLCAYLIAYSVRLSMMSWAGKRHVPGARAAFAASEFKWVSIFLIAFAVLTWAFVGLSDGGLTIGLSPRFGFGAMAGVSYAIVLVTGTLIYLDPREHSFTIPINRGASLVGGCAAAIIGGWVGLVGSPSVIDVTSAMTILCALLAVAFLGEAQRRPMTQ